MPEKIAFVGVGRMGANMARRLKDCGYDIVAVYDVHAPTAASVAEELGAIRAVTLAEVTVAAEVVFTVVTDDAAQMSVFAETGDSLLVGARGKAFINCATISPSTQVEVERRARKVGAESLEACMASSIPQARSGTLYLMCGGATETFARVKPLSAAHAAKDSGIASRLAEEVGLKLPLAEATRQQFDELVRLGLGNMDKSGIAELTFQRTAGMSLRRLDRAVGEGNIGTQKRMETKRRTRSACGPFGRKRAPLAAARLLPWQGNMGQGCRSAVELLIFQPGDRANFRCATPLPLHHATTLS